jgi:hypothetical protein
MFGLIMIVALLALAAVAFGAGFDSRDGFDGRTQTGFSDGS